MKRQVVQYAHLVAQADSQIAEKNTVDAESEAEGQEIIRRSCSGPFRSARHDRLPPRNPHRLREHPQRPSTAPLDEITKMVLENCGFVFDKDCIINLGHDSTWIRYEQTLHIHGHDNLWLDWMVDRSQIGWVHDRLLDQQSRQHCRSLRRLAYQPRLPELTLRFNISGYIFLLPLTHLQLSSTQSAPNQRKSVADCPGRRGDMAIRGCFDCFRRLAHT